MPRSGENPHSHAERGNEIECCGAWERDRMLRSVGMRAEMRWFIGILIVLAVALVIQSGLLAFAAYVLLGVLLLTRLLTREGLSRVEAIRVVSAEEVEAGERVEVEVMVRNAGRLPLPWVLLDDQLPAFALQQR